MASGDDLALHLLVRRLLCLLCFGLVVPAGGQPEGVADPLRLRGEISGEVKLKEDLLPPIPWRAVAEPKEGGTRFALVLEPPDGEVRLAVGLDAQGREAGWAIEQAWLDAAAWWPRLAPHVSPMLEGLQVGGRIRVSGQGRWTEGRITGPLTLTWSPVVLELATPSLHARDVELVLRLDEGWADGVFAGDGRLQIRELVVADVPLANLQADLSLHADQTLRVADLRFDALGGAIEAAPLAWRPGASELAFGLEFIAVDLAMLAQLMPDIVRDAQGRVSGRAQFRWREDLGLQPLGGELTDTTGQAVRVQLAPQPGFLTGGMSRRIQILPDWLGPLARKWLAPNNPVYPTLERIELGREPLVVDEFHFEFFPPDDPLGRTARVRISGHPQDDPQVKAVSLTINLAGPLTDLLKLGMQNQVRIQTGADPAAAGKAAP